MSSPEEQLEMIREALKKPCEDTSIKNTGAITGSLGTDTVTLNSGTGLYNNSTVIGGGYTVTPSISTPYYTTGGNIQGLNWGAGSNTNITANPWTNTHMSGKFNINGEEADIIINGVSLMEVLKDRLNVMIPNPALEKEWTELKELGDQYRALEKDLKEKAEIWAKLNKPS